MGVICQSQERNGETHNCGLKNYVILYCIAISFLLSTFMFSLFAQVLQFGPLLVEEGARWSIIHSNAYLLRSVSVSDRQSTIYLLSNQNTI